MGFLINFSKFILIGFNLFITVCAIIIIVLGAKSTYGGYNGFNIGLGVIILIVALLGFWGAIKENSCMLATYGSLMIVVFIIQLVLGIMVLYAANNSNHDLRDAISKSLDEYFNNEIAHQTDVDNIQKFFQCCGNRMPPLIKGSSCCGKENYEACSFTEYYTKTCSEAITQFAESYLKATGGVCIGFGIVELLAAFFAFYVRSHKKKSQYA